MKYNNLVLLSLVITLSSCVSNKNTSYRVLNKNGKIVYFERKKPLYNQMVQEDANNTNKITEKLNLINVNSEEDKKIDNNLVLDSSAYTLKSVVDTVVKSSDIKQLAKSIDKNEKTKTILDFDDIPEYYFNSKAQSKQQIQIENVNLGEQKTVKIEKQTNKKVNEKKQGFFSRLFGKNDNKNKKNEKDTTAIKNNNNKNVEQNKTITYVTNFDNTINEKKDNNIEENDNVKTGTVVFNNKQKLGKSKNSNYSGNIVKQNSNVQVNKKFELNNQVKQNDKLNVVDNKNNTKYVLASDNSQNSNKTINKINNQDNKVDIRTNNKKTTTINKTNNYLVKGKYYIQLGSFINKNRAYNLANKFNNVGTKQIVIPTTIKGKAMFRTVIGVFNTKAEAEKEIEKVLEKGYFDCYVFKE